MFRSWSCLNNNNMQRWYKRHSVNFVFENIFMSLFTEKTLLFNIIPIVWFCLGPAQVK